MGRGRGKGRRLTVASHDDHGSGDEEPAPIVRRRGRPQKSLKEEIDDDEADKVDEAMEMKGSSSLESGRKRRQQQAKDIYNSIGEEDITDVKPDTEEPIKTNGFRPNGSRRKNKPRRAAEAGVECN